MTDTTHFSTLESDVRKIANSCDLKGMNTDFFLTGTFVMNIAQYVQAREREAYQRGMRAALTPKP